MSKIRVLTYRLDIHKLQTKTVSFPNQEKILKEVVSCLAVSMNSNTENSQIKYCPWPKYLEVRNFSKQSFTILRSFEKFAKVWNREIFDLVALAKINSRENVQFFSHICFFLQKIFFSPRANNKICFY